MPPVKWDMRRRPVCAHAADYLSYSLMNYADSASRRCHKCRLFDQLAKVGNLSEIAESLAFLSATYNKIEVEEQEKGGYDAPFHQPCFPGNIRGTQQMPFDGKFAPVATAVLYYTFLGREQYQ